MFTCASGHCFKIDWKMLAYPLIVTITNQFICSVGPRGIHFVSNGHVQITGQTGSKRFKPLVYILLELLCWILFINIVLKNFESNIGNKHLAEVEFEVQWKPLPVVFGQERTSS